MSAQLRLGSDSVKADDIDAQVKSAKDQSIRALRDKADILKKVARLSSLGQPVQRQYAGSLIWPLYHVKAIYFHLTGTEYFEPVENDVVAASKQVWDMSLLSESTAVKQGRISCL